MNKKVLCAFLAVMLLITVLLPEESFATGEDAMLGLLSELEINVIDHIIVGRNGSFSLRASNHAQGIWTE